MLKKPCGKCPFGPNAKQVWKIFRDIESYRLEVIQNLIKDGHLNEGEPQICHTYLTAHLDEYEKLFPNDAYARSVSEEDVCVGHQQHLNSLRGTQSGKATRLSDVTGSTPVL